MITRQLQGIVRKTAAELIEKAGLKLCPEEIDRIEIADFGLGNLAREGAQILTLVQTQRYCVKVLALFANQTEPEHWHPPIGDDPGKDETVRVVWGKLFMVIEGENTMSENHIPAGKDSVYTCRHEIIMTPGSQLTLEPGAKHWFKAGTEGCVLFSFSSVARDGLDGFSDPGVERRTRIQ